MEDEIILFITWIIAIGIYHAYIVSQLREHGKCIDTIFHKINQEFTAGSFSPLYQ